MVVINKSVISKFTYLKTILKVKDNGPESIKQWLLFKEWTWWMLSRLIVANYSSSFARPSSIMKKDCCNKTNSLVQCCHW